MATVVPFERPGDRQGVDEAADVLAAAVRESERIRREAKDEAQAIVRQAHERAAAVIGDGVERAAALEAEITRLEAARDEIRSGCLSFLLDAYELVDGHPGVALGPASGRPG